MYEQCFTAALWVQRSTEPVRSETARPPSARQDPRAMLALPGEADGRSRCGIRCGPPFPDLDRQAGDEASVPADGSRGCRRPPPPRSSQKLLNYSQGFVREEMKLDVVPDGSPAVEVDGAVWCVRAVAAHEGTRTGFGRGSGRFLQNQIGNPVAYNYGRPAANYRDRFENATNAILGEHFELVSCTFETDKVVSLPDSGRRLANHPRTPTWC